MKPLKGCKNLSPLQGFRETPVILNIGRRPMLMALSPLGSKKAENYLSNCSLLDIRCLLLETNYSMKLNRKSPPFLKEVAEARSRRIRETNPPESPFAKGDER